MASACLVSKSSARLVEELLAHKHAHALIYTTLNHMSGLRAFYLQDFCTQNFYSNISIS
jgi:hypothetical protein